AITRTDGVADPLVLLELPLRITFRGFIQLWPPLQHEPEEGPHDIGQDLILRRVCYQQVELRRLHDGPAHQFEIRSVRVEHGLHPCQVVLSAPLRSELRELDLNDPPRLEQLVGDLPWREGTLVRKAGGDRLLLSDEDALPVPDLNDADEC